MSEPRANPTPIGCERTGSEFDGHSGDYGSERIEKYNQDYITDYHFSELSGKLKEVTWLIKVTRGQQIHYCTGFAIKSGDSVRDNFVVLMSCASSLHKGKCRIEARRVDDTVFFKVKTIKLHYAWDVSLLAVEGVKSDIVAEFPEDAFIMEFDTLIHVGHGDGLVWSTFVGRAMYKCVNEVNLPSDVGETCDNHFPSDLITPAYRTMGDVWNPVIDALYSKLEKPFVTKLSSQIPIIQSTGLCGRKACMGGPVFNSKGCVVGLMVGELESCQVAVHVSLLKEFAKMNSTKIEEFYKEYEMRLKRKAPDSKE